MSISHDSAIYILASVAVFPVSLLIVLLLTQYLSPEEFEQLAILLILAALLALLVNLVWLRGTLRCVFGPSGDEEMDGGDAGRAKGWGLSVSGSVPGSRSAWRWA